MVATKHRRLIPQSPDEWWIVGAKITQLNVLLVTVVLFAKKICKSQASTDAKQSLIFYERTDFLILSQEWRYRWRMTTHSNDDIERWKFTPNFRRLFWFIHTNKTWNFLINHGGKGNTLYSNTSCGTDATNIFVYKLCFACTLYVASVVDVVVVFIVAVKCMRQYNI